MSGIKYFDLTTRGLGFVSEIRHINPENGTPFTSLNLSALRGKAGEAQYTHFQVIPAGDEVNEVVRLMKPYVDGKRKVLISFDLGNVRGQAFLYKDGPREGEPGASLRARLIRVNWVKVDGNVVYNRKAEIAAAV